MQKAWGGSTAFFHQMLVKEGFALFALDNRGSPNRGKKFSAAIRKQFGGVELKDQLAALDQLEAQYPQLDPMRIAIWGWSNGGSMSLYALTHSGRFKTGISVAPVTSQRNYDSIYTERYMGLPKENAKGYDDSIVSTAGNLRGSLLLAHGTARQRALAEYGPDDRCADQSGQAVPADALSEQDTVFPVRKRARLFRMMEDFWNKELK